jgi:hypothetical protein
MRLSIDESRFITKVTTLGSSRALPIVMSPSELAKLIGVIYRDVKKSEALAKTKPGLWEKINPEKDYYEISESWFSDPIELEPFEHIDLWRHAQKDIPDVNTYLQCLSELHKRRKKYSLILKSQPIPTMVQVSPRALVEYGCIDSEALASWLTWRKFFYDLDNRSAQETGYLFEPILASAIGGEPLGAKKSHVKRTEDKSKGRQVDCWKVVPGDKPLAYEFKLRVTIAASGQGRFKEEMQFAEDCQTSGAVPIIVILDPTPNPRMSELKAAYEAKGGKAYIGDEAWRHLEEQAGSVMFQFIERYVRKPLSDVSAFEVPGDESTEPSIKLLDLGAKSESGKLHIQLGSHERMILRKEDKNLSDSNSESES